MTYFVWPGAERMYKVLLQGTGENARLAVHFWGINSPSAGPQVRIEGNLGAPATGQPAKGLTASTASGFSGYDWACTYTNLATGHEGNPSAGLALTLTTVSQYDYAKLSIPVDTGGDPQTDGIRVYRSGGLNVNYTRVGEIKLADAHLINGVGTVDFIDKKSDSEIFLAPQVRLDNYVPFVSTNQNGDAVWNANVGFIFGPFADRVILGIGEKNQPGNVFWTNPSRPDSSGPNNNAQVTSARDPLVSGLVYNGLPYVASRGDWYALDFSIDAEGNAAFTPRRTQAGKGPIGPWAAASGDSIYFVTQDRVMKTDGQSPAQSISEDINIIFHSQSTPEYAAIDFSSAQELFRLYWAAPELHFLYPDTSGEMQHLILDGAKWRSETFASDGYSADYPNAPWTYAPVMHPTCVYWDVAYPQRSVLMGTDRKAVFVQRPYQSGGVETSYFDYDSDNGSDWESTSRAGWVVGRFRTHSDDYERPSHLKELGDVSFEASVPQAAVINTGVISRYGQAQGAAALPSTPCYPETALTLYANAESGTLAIDSSIEPSTALTGVPIGSDIYNTAVTGRQRFPLGIDNIYQYVYSTAWDFSFIGPWNFHNLTVFWRTDSEVITHWHQCNQDFGHNGWLHARDGFVDARLYGDATLTLEVDLEFLRSLQNMIRLNRTMLLSFVWSRFLDANRFPLLLKTLQINHSSSASSKVWPDTAGIASGLLPF